jgi:hypothetical protein
VSSGAGATVYAGDFAANSDGGLKNISGTIENPMVKVMALRGVRYTWNDEASKFGFNKDESQIGVVAQDVEAVLPEAVKYRDGYRLVSYDRLVPLLVEAIKTLNEKIEKLEKH